MTPDESMNQDRNLSNRDTKRRVGFRDTPRPVKVTSVKTVQVVNA